MRPRRQVLLLAVAVTLASACRSALPPANPDAGMSPDPGPQLAVPPLQVGDDAIVHWDRWAQQRIGTRSLMRSTYDRTGGNEAADASHFLWQTPAYYVTLDLAGQGTLAFVRTNRWHGSPWHYVVDGIDTVVTETNTQNPDQPVDNAVFSPVAAFPSPLALTESTTQGADLSWVPVGFQNSLQLGYERTDYGTGYYIVQLYPPGATNLSQPIAPFTVTAPAQAVLDLLAQAGQDIAPHDATVTAQSGTVDLPAGATTSLVTLLGARTIRSLRFTVPLGQEQALGAAQLRITWDDRTLPSIDVPVALFFGAGSLYNRNNAHYLVQALPVHIRFDAEAVELATYFPMPFFHGAQITLQSAANISGVQWEVRTQPYTDPTNWAGYFHATFHDQGVPVAGHDLVLLDTTSDEGGGDWSGAFVGTAFTFSDRAVLTTLEGDPRFFFDDSQTPQAQGTGTEEWGGGGDYWNGGQVTTLPLAGHPVGAPSAASAANAQDEIESAYRYLLPDAMAFGKNARIALEHGGTDESTEHYRTVALWYGLPGASLVVTDTLHVSDAADERRHHYGSAKASVTDTLTSRYEWGVDTLNGAQTYPATTDTGRHTQGTSQFTLALNPENYGVLLRRKLDYAYPDQRADVSIADDVDGAPFVAAGTWYLAGGSTYLFADSSSETSNTAPSIETSSHRWRDDEFMIPRQLTEGRPSIRVRVTFTPTNRPLMAGQAVLPQAWSEYRYTAYCWVLPPSR